MGLEILKITGYAYWRTVVGMVYSTVFDKCPSPVNWVEPIFASQSKQTAFQLDEKKPQMFDLWF